MKNYLMYQTDEPTATETATATYTPTITPTPTNTPTPTPDFYAVWTLVPESTEEAGQAVAFKYEITAGDATISVLLFALFTIQLIGIFIWRRRE